MMYKTIVMLLASILMQACDKSHQQPAVQSENVVSPTQASIDASSGTDVIINTDSSASKRKQLNTKITPDMIKNIRFDASSDSDAEVYADKPFNLDPAGSTRISVTPKLFFKEELDFSHDYMDNIDGAFVQFEMKFN